MLKVKTHFNQAGYNFPNTVIIISKRRYLMNKLIKIDSV